MALKIGMIGTNFISDDFCEAAAQVPGAELFAVYSRKQETGDAFAAKHNIPRVYTDYDEFLDSGLDAVYVASPNFAHCSQTLKALDHKKHVLCEKAITLDIGELKEAQALAEERGLVLAEAMTIYHMPLYKRLREIAEGGALGKLCMIQMNFGSFKEYDMTNRFFNPDLAGGALWDIGVYALSFIRWFMS